MNIFNKSKKYRASKNFAIFFVLFVVLLATVTPYIASAQIITCGNQKDANGRIIDECSFYDLVDLANRLISTLIKFSFPAAAAVIAWAGIFMMLNPANSSKRTEALGIIKNVMIGFAIILASWIVVKAVVSTIMKDSAMIDKNTGKSTIPIEGF